MTLRADDLLSALRDNGHRITRARREICRVLTDASNDHLTAGDVVDLLEGSGVDPSTVYRTLDALEELGLIQHLHLGHGAGAYHVAPARAHHHLVCESCGRTTDVPLAEMRAAVESVTVAHGFVADLTHFAIVGRCAGCAAGAP